MTAITKSSFSPAAAKYCMGWGKLPIYECKIYNKENPQVEFEKIYNGNLNEQKMVFKKFKQNMEKREKMNQISHPSEQSDKLLFTVWDK